MGASQKKNGTKKKTKTQKSNKVTNASMDKHIERMNKTKHSKSNSSESVKKKKNSKKAKTKSKNLSPKSNHGKRSSVPNLMNQSHSLTQERSRAATEINSASQM